MNSTPVTADLSIGRNTSPFVSYVFHASEIWLILVAMGVVAKDLTAPAEITTQPETLVIAREQLARQRIVSTDAQGNMQVALDVAAVVRSSAYPEMVFVVNVSDSSRVGQPPRVICFGWTPDSLVVNWVDEANRHHFVAYSARKTGAVLLDYLGRLCDLNVDEPSKTTTLSAPQDLERVMAQARQTVLVMAVNGIQLPEQTTRAVGWFISGRHAWLMQSEAGRQAPRATSRADIELAVNSLIEQTLAAYVAEQ